MHIRITLCMEVGDLKRSHPCYLHNLLALELYLMIS